MITRSREHLNGDGLPTAEMLRSVLAEHHIDAQRMGRLADAYDAKSQILTRVRRDGLPNNRIAHPYARYITTIATGYLIGQPVAYSVSGDSDTLQQVQDAFRRGSEAAENTQIARDQSIYGKGVEYVHVDADGNPHTTAVSPLNAFVVYDDTYDMRPLFGVYYLPKRRADGTQDGWHVWVMTDRLVLAYATDSLDALPRADAEAPKEHFFGGVPLIEYWNNERETGDFEQILPLIDAYDTLESDRVNDKEQFVDRLLVLTGAILETDDQGRTPMQQLKEDHALQLPDTASRAEYLTSEMNETSVEVLRNAIVEDIHKLSMVPDMSDENFAANASGVAMRYKLLGFEQMIRIKEQWFAEGLRARLRLFLNFLTLRGAPPLAVEDITITFTHALPANLAENAEIVRNAVGASAVSTATAVRMLHHGENWTEDDIEQETQAIRDERAAEAPDLLQGNMLFGDITEQLTQNG